jgi:hypothetical protein
MATRRTRRNGEMNQGHLKHNSPHPVVRPDEKVRSSRTVRAIFCNAGGLASQAFDVARGCCIERCTFDDGSAQIWYRDLSPTIAQRSISALLRVRVPMVLGRVATALHPASSSVRRVDVAGYNRCPVLMTSRRGPRGRETNHDTDREGEDDANSVRDQRRVMCKKCRIYQCFWKLHDAKTKSREFAAFLGFAKQKSDARFLAGAGRPAPSSRACVAAAAARLVRRAVPNWTNGRTDRRLANDLSLAALPVLRLLATTIADIERTRSRGALLSQPSSHEQS